MKISNTATTATSDDVMGFCTIRPGEVKGVNQHRAVQYGECPHHGERYRRDIDWSGRQLGGWEPTDD